MSRSRSYSFLDRLFIEADKALRTLGTEAVPAGRESPAEAQQATPLTSSEARHVTGLMRINHAGEVCAQGLYQGQAMTARLSEVREAMQEAAEEEEDHLAWCEQRIRELDGAPSVLNPLWYAMSFGIGAAAGMVGDRWSLGFVAATEDQVCKHLRNHLDQLPEGDGRTRVILEQMLEDEAAHKTQALEAGGADFPAPVKKAMTLVSRVMTRTTYHI